MAAPQTQGGFLSGLMPNVLEDFERKAREEKYFDNPTLWAYDKLGVNLWYKQTEVADAIATGDKKAVAVRAGHGVGKSFLAAILACWYVFVASTAPSADQVTAILWREIRNAWSLSHKRYAEYLRLTKLGHDTHGLPDRPMPGIITQDNRWKDDMGNLIAQGRKPPDHNEDSFQGIHAQYVLAIGDEACGLNINMIDSLANITSNAKSRRLLIANPTNPRSRLGQIFSNEPDENDVIIGQAWSQHHISVMDSPNFHGGGKCIDGCLLRAEHDLQPFGLGLDQQALESLTDQSYVDEKILEYGLGSARFKARVLGEFAYDAGDNLFEDFDIAKARDAVCFVSYDSPLTRTVLGVDVARSKHGDTTYVYRFTNGLMHDWQETVDAEGAKDYVIGAVGGTVGGELRFVAKYRGVPLTDRYEENGDFTVGQAKLIHQWAVDLNATEVRVDSGGLGIGLVDGLRLYARGKYRVIEMQGGAPTPDGRQWINNRAYQFAQMRDRFRAGIIDIDPTDKILIQQLEDILGEFVDPHGALKIESKDSMKKRGVKSPDAADAGWYACANLTHLDGPKDGDIVSKTPEQIMNELVLSGYTDPYPF
jgi:hypothetical protein